MAQHAAFEPFPAGRNTVAAADVAPGPSRSRRDAGARASDRNWRAKAVVDFVGADPMLRSFYLLQIEGGRGQFETGSPESMFAFLLWFLVHGREHYPQPLVVPDHVREALAFPDRAGRHPLMTYAAEQSARELGGEALRAWFYREAVPQRGLAPFLSRAELARLPERHAKLPPALARLAAGAAGRPALPCVAIVGMHRSVMGIGEDARCLHDCLLELGIPAELVDVSPPGLEADPAATERYRPFEAKRPTASVLVFCLPPLETMRAVALLGMGRPLQPQHRIGYWPWETTALPDAWHHVFDLVDEVWAPSAFLRGVYQGATRKPVRLVPPCVRVAEPVLPQGLASLLEARFTFLSVFDFNSRIERKNPLGAVEAFRRAFPPHADVQLVFKTINGDKRAAAFDTLRRAAGEDERIVVVDGPLTGAELAGLIAGADAFLSLHRAEGFGRLLAEAMLLGTPVVATGWSGPTDYLDERTGYPVRARLRSVGAEEYPWAAGEWAEPDLDHAAAQMRRVYLGHAGAARIVEAAEQAVERRYGLDSVTGTLAVILGERLAPEPR